MGFQSCWAALDRGIYNFWNHLGHVMLCCSRILPSEIPLFAEAPFGKVIGGYRRLRTALCGISLTWWQTLLFWIGRSFSSGCDRCLSLAAARSISRYDRAGNGFTISKYSSFSQHLQTSLCKLTIGVRWIFLSV